MLGTRQDENINRPFDGDSIEETNQSQDFERPIVGPAEVIVLMDAKRLTRHVHSTE
jgi:hypothetical protein